MKRIHWLSLIPVMALVPAILACNALTSLNPLQARPTATPTAGAAAAPGQKALKIEGGPVIGSPRETRVAISEQTSTLEELASEKYDDKTLAQVGQTFSYTAALDKSQKLIWAYGWCATTRAILEQNLERMTLDFSANGTAVDTRQFYVVDGQTSDLQCRYYAAVVSDWPAGTTTLETKVTFTEKINDGLSDYAAGSQTFVYTVTLP